MVVSNSVADCPWVSEYLVVVATRGGLVAPEVDLRIERLAVCVEEVAEAEAFVPAGGKDVEADLAANGISKAEVWKVFL